MSSPQVGSDGSPVVDRRRPMIVSGFTTPYNFTTTIKRSSIVHLTAVPLSIKCAHGFPFLNTKALLVRTRESDTDKM